MSTQLGIFDRLDAAAKLTKLGDPLKVLNDIVPFSVLSKDIPELPMGEKGGRPAISNERMLRLLVIQHLYRLSDEQLEYQTLDRVTFQRFAGIDRPKDVPDFSTVWRFRERLGEAGARAIFDKLDHYISSAGFEASGGQIVDASIVQRGRSRRDPKESTVPTRQEAAHRDDDATWTKKHDRSYYGYKAHVNADAAEGFVRAVEVTTASVADGQMLDALTAEVEAPRDASVYADRAYPSAENAAMLAEKGLKDDIAVKRKPGKDLPPEQRQANRRRNGVRARVEHVFAHQNGHRAGGRWVNVVGLARVTVKLVLDQVAYNLSRLSFKFRTQFNDTGPPGEALQGSCA